MKLPVFSIGPYGVWSHSALWFVKTLIPTDLTQAERRDLARLEGVIQTAQRSALEEAKALRQIRIRRLYRQTHRTFEAYCIERWKFSRGQAYRLCEWAEIVESFVTNGGKSYPVRESHARPLIRLTQQQRRQAWKAVQERHPGGFEARHFEVVANEVLMEPMGDGAGVSPPAAPKIIRFPAPRKKVEEPQGQHVPMRSPLGWYGGKGSLSARIVALLPDPKSKRRP